MCPPQRVASNRIDNTSCILTLSAEDAGWLTRFLLRLPFATEVIDPPQLRRHIRSQASASFRRTPSCQRPPPVQGRDALPLPGSRGAPDAGFDLPCSRIGSDPFASPLLLQLINCADRSLGRMVLR